MKTITKAIIAATAALLGASFFSCDSPVSLGRRLNLDPPVVEIIKPDFMANVGGMLDVTGTASDMEEIVQISVTVERVSKTGDSWKQEWVAERGAWKSRAASASWEPRSEGGWQEVEGKGKISWSIPVDLSKAPNGEYAIIAGAVNNVQNAGAMVERRVVIDTEPPVVSIITPEVESSYDGFDAYALRNPTLISRLFNQLIKVQYEIKDSFSISTLTFQLADKDGNIYYSKPVESPGWNGKAEIKDSEIVDADGFEVTEKLYAQLISRVTDRAGNERVYSHGWLVYWPESDRPWTMDVGASVAKDFPVYPRTEVQGRAYDDDGVREVSWQIFHYSTWSSGVPTPAPGYEDGPKTQINKPMAEGATPSTFFSWNFTAPEDCDEYIIEINCKDINGLAGITITRLFYVLDSSASNVEVYTPDRNKTLFGNTSGAFDITGRAGDGSENGPAKLAIVWLNPTTSDPQTQILYQSSDYAGWNSVNTSTTVTDTGGNKLWGITMGTAYYDSILNRTFKDFTKSLNLFSDLNIGAGANQNPLTAQTFILRVEGDNGKATTLTHSVQGDIEPPKLDIAMVTVARTGAADRTYTKAQLESVNMDALEEGDKITITGTWGDDSLTAWGGSPLRMRLFTVTWNGEALPTPTLAAAGTWSAGPLTLDNDQIMRGGGRIEARLTDYGNNTTIAPITARVDSNIPRLMFISSDKPDGAYNADATGNRNRIDIYLEFNKAVSVNATPSLTLSNGQTAAYQGTINTDSTRHVFRYEIAAGHTNVDKLGVTSINPTNAVWSGSGGRVPAMAAPAGQNLQDLKSIKVDTAAPTILSVQSLTGEPSAGNYYRQLRTIYLLVTFSEPINFSGSNATLSLNSNYNSSGTAGTAVNAANPVLSGTSALLYTYTVGNNQNTPFTPPATYTTPLTAAFAVTGNAITDLAGNALTNTAIPTNINGGATASARAIYIDTTAPAAPTFGTGSSLAGTYDPTVTAPSFTLTGEAEATFEYRTSASGNWIPYNGAVTLNATGTHNVAGRQKDRAGNVSDASAPREYIIKTSAPLLTSISSTTAPGTYKTGQAIDIVFNLREAVPLTGGVSFTLGLNAATGRQTANATATANNTLTFRYTVQNGDAANPLQITSLNLTGSNTLATELKTEWDKVPAWGTTTGKQLSDFAPFTIDTTTPALAASNPIVLNAAGETLTISFNKTIAKGTGSITLTQVETTALPYLAPAVMTTAEYQRYGGAAVLGSYYTRGTNGTTVAGVADLTEKYVLNYNIETNNTALTTQLKNRGANKVEVSVASGAVTVSGSAMTVNLTGTNALPVKGVSYEVRLSAGLVQDNLSNVYPSANYTHGTNLLYQGTNPPYIRVAKASGSIGSATVYMPGQPNGQTGWVRNVPLTTTAPNPNSTNWQVDPFSIDFPWEQDFTAAGTISRTDPNNNQYIPNSLAHFQGELYYHNSQADTYRISWYQNNDGNPWTLIYATGREGQANAKNPFWVNPYNSTIIYPVLDGGNTGGWTLTGNLWADTTTVTTGANSPGQGYIRVTQTGAPVAVQVPVANQPLTTTVKIDCQTPGAVITYLYNTGTSTQYGGNGDQNSTPDKTPNFPRAAGGLPNVTMPTQAQATTAYNRGTLSNQTLPGRTTITLGNNTATNRNGYLYGITAVATPPTGYGATAAVAYEKAARSVIQFNNPPFNNGIKNATPSGRLLQLWLRGGDFTSGDNTTPGFPLSWNERDYSGIQLLTGENINDNNGTWYWMTWEVNANAYFHFIAGTTSTAAEAANGPHEWSWSKNAWTFQYDKFPLHPGESLLFTRTTTYINGQPDGDYDFFDRFMNSR